MNKRLLYLILAACFFNVLSLTAQEVVELNAGEKLRNFGTKLYLLKDEEHEMGLEAVLKSKKFQKLETLVPNLGATDDANWVKVTIKNNTDDPKLAIQIPLPTIDFVDFYQVDSGNKVVRSEFMGDRRPYSNRTFDNPFSTFEFEVQPGQKTTIILRISGGEQLQVPLTLANSVPILESNSDSFIIFGIYAGVICVMFIYNLFLYLSTKDNTYLYYCVYIFFIGLLQANFQGFPFRYLWPNNMWLSTYAVYILTPLGALSAIEFMKRFLHTKDILPEKHKWLNIFYVPYSIAIIFLILGYFNICYQMLQYTAMAIAVYMLYVAYKISQTGYRPAKFFIIAWTVFLLGLFIFVLKDLNILPYNTLTYNMMPFGSALEVTLLSFALADKINIFKREKEESQAEALRVITENERLVREQNIVLEVKVKERTEELELALTNLKEAQSQLVDSEKMAGLGQLTAGIAHEINNPINFVTSNIKPLELDILDLDTVINMYENLDPEAELQPQIAKIESFKKQIDIVFVREEIKSLLSGIGEGARRTAEIIRSLKNFSRLDENDTKPVDLNEGIASTLVLVKNTFPDHLQLVKEFGDLPPVECLPGKLNQVFMNLITNAVYAIKSKKPKDDEGILAIKTWQDGTNVKISIKDSGTGMPDEVKQKIFEPFFTTKDVGEGTGLGLSIVFRIIENHNGNIDVITKLNQGTEFIITLPINSK
jgi:two-component system NtrC family sensor kinase